MTCIKMGSDESHFNVSLIVRDKVTRQCLQTTTFEEKGEPKRYPSAYQPTALPPGQTGFQGYTPRVQDTNTASDTHSEQRPIVQLTGEQGPARATSLNSQH